MLALERGTVLQTELRKEGPRLLIVFEHIPVLVKQTLRITVLLHECRPETLRQRRKLNQRRMPQALARAEDVEVSAMRKQLIVGICHNSITIVRPGQVRYGHCDYVSEILHNIFS